MHFCKIKSKNQCARGKIFKKKNPNVQSFSHFFSLKALALIQVTLCLVSPALFGGLFKMSLKMSNTHIRVCTNWAFLRRLLLWIKNASLTLTTFACDSLSSGKYLYVYSSIHSIQVHYNHKEANSAKEGLHSLIGGRSKILPLNSGFSSFIKS